MPSLYITEQGATLRKEQNRLVVERDGRVIASLHEFKLDRVVLFGNVQVSTQAMTLLMDKGIDTAFVSLSGRLRGRLVPLASKNVTLRLTQFERYRDRGYALDVSRAIVTAKITNCIHVLMRYRRYRLERSNGAETAHLAELLKKVGRTASVDSLRGIEGQAAAVYFESFGRLLRRGFEFAKRTRRPPKDPVNAMLSFGYALLYNEAISAVTGCGFDPYVGFYHAVSYGRCSLALDLMEEMRPLVADRLALYLANTETLSASQFRSENDGVRLDGGGRKRFLRAYEDLMNNEFRDRTSGRPVSLRLALYAQAQHLLKSVMDRGPYRGFSGWR